MENETNEEFAVVEAPTTGDLIKESAVKAVTYAVVSVVVAALAQSAMTKIQTKYIERRAKKNATVIDTTATED